MFTSDVGEDLSISSSRRAFPHTSNDPGTNQQYQFNSTFQNALPISHEESYPLDHLSAAGKAHVNTRDREDYSVQSPLIGYNKFNELRALFRQWVLRSGPVSYEQLSGPKPKIFLGLDGWRLGTLLSTVAFAVCLLIEISLLITANAVKGVDRSQDILYQGSCGLVKKYTLLTLIPFNIVGTLMIGYSNYVMQILGALSRKEIDARHGHAQDFNIGVSSAQNHIWAKTPKRYLWWVLGLTTIPIHLMLNSVVFATLQTNEYGVIVAGQSFLTTNSSQICPDGYSSYEYSLEEINEFGSSNNDICYIQLDYTRNTTLYDTLDAQTCAERYRDVLQGAASNLNLITNGDDTMWQDALQNIDSLPNDGSFYTSLPYIIPSPNIYDWTKTSFAGNFTSFDFSRKIRNVPGHRTGNCTYSWTSTNATIGCSYGNQTQSFTVDQCLSKRTVEHCTMQYSLTILVCILVCDIVKFLAMLYILKSYLRQKHSPNKDDEIIAVLGDAIASFLERPDETSADRCLINQRQIREASRLLDGSTLNVHKEHPFWQKSIQDKISRLPRNSGPRPQAWHLEQHRWASGPSRTRWTLFISLFIALIAGTGAIFGLSLSSLGDVSFSNIWSQGVGKIDPSNVFAAKSFSSSLIRGVLLINLPQLLFSYMYFAYNGLFTCMHAGYEWSQFASPARKTLRVSTPKANQRSTYRLSLPWRYSLPLIGTSTLLHWLVSRSLFVVKIDVYGITGKQLTRNNIAACGYSPLALILVIMILVLMLIVMVGFAMRKLVPGIPVVGTCSWAIAAACHAIGGDVDAAEKPLMWGVIQEGLEGRPGHCAVTSRPVTAPIEGNVYQ